MDSLMGWNLKDWRSYGGWVRDMEIVPCLDENNLVVGATREEYVTGFPWKNESFGFEERVVVAMAAIVSDDDIWIKRKGK